MRMWCKGKMLVGAMAVVVICHIHIPSGFASFGVKEFIIMFSGFHSGFFECNFVVVEKGDFE